MSIGFSPPDINKVRGEYVKLAKSSHYQHYDSFRQRIDAGMEILMPGIVEDLNAFHGSLASELTDYQSIHRSARKNSRSLAIVTALALILTVVSGAVIWSTGAASDQWLLLLVTISFAVAAAVTSAFRARARSVALRIEAESKALEVQLERRTNASVKQAFTRVLNETLGPENMLPFPTVAPRLVELNTSAVVPSSTATFLKNFVEGHESSAIGIAGPRGSGKSTLMRGLTSDAEHIDRSVWLTAPVRYDSVDFVRRLYLEVAKKVDERNGGELRSLRRRRYSSVLIGRTIIGAILFTIGFALIFYDSYGGEIFSQPAFSATGVAGMILFTSGLLVVLLGAVASLTRRSYVFGGGVTGQQGYAAFLAREAITRLSFDRETNTKSKNVAKFLGGSLALEDENSVTLKDRALSHADLISELRKLLQAFAEEEDSKPVIIVIDELDKISLTTDLVDTVNDLKDLFHIEGVHFIVSVSTDALLSFEQRGLVARDAFDSSFDTIVPVRALSLDESLQVISARAEGFPPLVSAFCHAWSGGLPRELLRIARRCVEIQRSTKEAQPVELLVRTVIAEDIISLVEAAMRSTSTAAKRDYLHQVRLHARLLREGHVSTGSSVSIPKSLQSIANVAALGEGLITYFATSVRVGDAEWSTPERYREPLEASARAMALKGEPEEIRAEAFEKASAVLLSTHGT
ncbi:hypothetical protein FDK12_02080 [Arthrobacter sp. NamB2]|uniref:P-loop NTPase fold protein n=1 Tax=Arthrobacter sp. NamB2 TaxID=2576035 RepID=UPI0010C9EF60|nr:P-loop NTPase fold protein [Arthrobacter sp. NamB2]TKV29724.1 hypothetical protein FDK12_02080 [Arthrobacter sp. NamB2]